MCHSHIYIPAFEEDCTFVNKRSSDIWSKCTNYPDPRPRGAYRWFGPGFVLLEVDDNGTLGLTTNHSLGAEDDSTMVGILGNGTLDLLPDATVTTPPDPQNQSLGTLTEDELNRPYAITPSRNDNLTVNSTTNDTVI